MPQSKFFKRFYHLIRHIIRLLILRFCEVLEVAFQK